MAEHEVLNERLIAFLDILGFSARLSEMPARQLHALYAALIDDVQSTVFDPRNLAAPEQRDSNFARAQFLFDSIVLVSHSLEAPSASKSVFSFISACIALMEKCFELKLPLRGAIGFGDYFEDKPRNIFLSSVFPKIVQAEKTQEWSGCFLLPEAASRVISPLFGWHEAAIGKPKKRHPIVQHVVPLKNAPASATSQDTRRWCLNWVHFLDDESVTSGLDFLSEPKRSGTRTFVEYVRALADDLVPLPESFRPATEVRVQVALGGLRMKFCDADGRGVDPPDGAQINIEMMVDVTK